MKETVSNQLEYWDKVKDPHINPAEYNELQGMIWNNMEKEMIIYLLSLL